MHRHDPARLIIVVALATLPGCSRSGPEPVQTTTQPPAVLDTTKTDTPANGVYTIKLKNLPAAGKSIEARELVEEIKSTRVTLPGGKEHETLDKITREKISTITVLEGGDPRPRKYRQAFTKATIDDGKKPAISPFHGRTVVYVDRNDRYEASVEGDPQLPADVLQSLADDANSHLAEAILPDRAIKVGESWSVNIGKLTEQFRPLGTIASAEGAATLVKVYARDRQQWGTLDISIKLTLSKLKSLECETPAILEARGRLNTAIDGSSTAGTMDLTLKIAGKFTVVQGQQKVPIELISVMKGKEEHSQEK